MWGKYTFQRSLILTVALSCMTFLQGCTESRSTPIGTHKLAAAEYYFDGNLEPRNVTPLEVSPSELAFPGGTVVAKGTELLAQTDERLKNKTDIENEVNHNQGRVMTVGALLESVNAGVMPDGFTSDSNPHSSTVRSLDAEIASAILAYEHSVTDSSLTLTALEAQRASLTQQLTALPLCASDGLQGSQSETGVGEEIDASSDGLLVGDSGPVVGEENGESSEVETPQSVHAPSMTVDDSLQGENQGVVTQACYSVIEHAGLTDQLAEIESEISLARNDSDFTFREALNQLQSLLGSLLDEYQRLIDEAVTQRDQLTLTAPFDCRLMVDNGTVSIESSEMVFVFIATEQQVDELSEVDAPQMIISDKLVAILDLESVHYSVEATSSSAVPQYRMVFALKDVSSELPQLSQGSASLMYCSDGLAIPSAFLGTDEAGHFVIRDGQRVDVAVRKDSTGQWLVEAGVILPGQVIEEVNGD